MTSHAASRGRLFGLLSTSMLIVLVHQENMLGNYYYQYNWQSTISERSLTQLSSFGLEMSENNSATRRTTTIHQLRDTQTSSTRLLDNNNTDPADEDIRRWGCAPRTETPLLFVHIGKMGGGSVRARFAAAALDYQRGPENWFHSNDTTAHYPVQVNATHTARASFCNSGSPNYRILPVKTFEGTQVCAALTPLGHAAACPIHVRHLHRTCLNCRLDDNACHRVYVGHNLLGNELHWLPPAWLAKWWQDYHHHHHQYGSFNTHDNSNSSKEFDSMAMYWQRLQGPDWCPELGKGRILDRLGEKKYFQNCSVPLAQQVDRLANTWIRQQQSSQSQTHRDHHHHHHPSVIWPASLGHLDLSANWGPLYASLPVLRTTVVRNPFGWLLSKFFWHGYQKYHHCTDVKAAVGQPADWFGVELDNDRETPGWVHRTARQFIIQLCGEDCQSKWEYVVSALGKQYSRQHEEALLRSFERQADYNLRHSFAVVGQLEEIDVFYKTVSRRVQYVDMSLNLNVTGKRHPTRTQKDCKAAFRTKEFQQALVKGSPAVAAMVRLYQTAVRVNEFQKKELSECARE